MSVGDWGGEDVQELEKGKDRKMEPSGNTDSFTESIEKALPDMCIRGEEIARKEALSRRRALRKMRARQLARSEAKET